MKKKVKASEKVKITIQGRLAPIGWHFSGKHEQEFRGYDMLPEPSPEERIRYWRGEAVMYRIAFIVTLLAFAAVAIISII